MRWNNLLLIFLIAAILFVVIFYDLPGDTKLWRELQNTGHTFAFGVLALIVLALFRSMRLLKLQSSLRLYLLVIAVCVFIALITELIQWVLSRDADLQDIYRDFAGVFVFLNIAILYFSGNRRDIEYKPNNFRVMLVVVSFVVLIVALLPLGKILNAYYHRSKAFPVIVDFGSSWSKTFVAVNHAELQTMLAPPGWIQNQGKTIARVKLNQAKYPGMVIEELESDWYGFKNLNFRVYVGDEKLQKLTVRIHDKSHNNTLKDRFNESISLVKGDNLIQIPLEKIRTAPEIRNLNIREISQIILFSGGIKKPTVFYLSNIWLS